PEPWDTQGAHTPHSPAKGQVSLAVPDPAAPRYNPRMKNGFAAELKRLGPGSSSAPVSLARAWAYCGRLARTHYENFSVASLLLPRGLVRPSHSVYAFCRWADDLADGAGGGSEALALLRWGRSELLACYDGHPRHPVLIALRETIRRFRIPPQPF